MIAELPDRLPELALNEAPRVALMFPGQGSQYPGMAANLHAREPIFRAALDQVLELISSEGGAAVRPLVLGEGGADAQRALRATEMAQPAIFAVEYALVCLLRDWGVQPVAHIGHSVGEVAAATASGLFTVEAAARFVTLRGALMQRLPPGAMISVNASPDILASCLAVGIDLAAVNAPNQSVFSGPDSLISEIEATLAAEGFAARRLHTSHAFHSAMMSPILPLLEAALAETVFGALSTPLVSNVTGGIAEAGLVGAPSYWARHVRSPVRFSAGLSAVLALRPDLLIEVGPGRSLGALARQCGADRVGVRIVPTIPGALEAPSDLIGDARAALEAFERETQ